MTDDSDTIARNAIPGDVIPGAAAWSATGDGARAAVGVLVVHGITGNPNSTRPLGESLHDEGYTVTVPRLPGHGTNVDDLRTTRYGDWRAAVENDAAALVDTCEQLVLVGQSMGGTLCLDVAADRGDVAGVVAINAQILDPTQPLARLAPILQHLVPVVPRDLAGLPSDDIARPGADERAYAYVAARPVQSLIRELPRIRTSIAGLRCPLLVAWSPQDHTVPPRNSRALVDLVGSHDVRELVLGRSYHVATLDWDAALLTEAVVAFVSRVTGT